MSDWELVVGEGYVSTVEPENAANGETSSRGPVVRRRYAFALRDDVPVPDGGWTTLLHPSDCMDDQSRNLTCQGESCELFVASCSSPMAMTCAFPVAWTTSRLSSGSSRATPAPARHTTGLLHAAGVDARRQKPVRDQIAAQAMLQAWLDSNGRAVVEQRCRVDGARTVGKADQGSDGNR